MRSSLCKKKWEDQEFEVQHTLGKLHCSLTMELHHSHLCCALKSKMMTGQASVDIKQCCLIMRNQSKSLSTSKPRKSYLLQTFPVLKFGKTFPTLEAHENVFNDANRPFLTMTCLSPERCDAQFSLPHYPSSTTCSIFLVAFV